MLSIFGAPILVNQVKKPSSLAKIGYIVLILFLKPSNTNMGFPQKMIGY